MLNVILNSDICAVIDDDQRVPDTSWDGVVCVAFSAAEDVGPYLSWDNDQSIFSWEFSRIPIEWSGDAELSSAEDALFNYCSFADSDFCSDCCRWTRPVSCDAAVFNASQYGTCSILWSFQKSFSAAVDVAVDMYLISADIYFRSSVDYCISFFNIGVSSRFSARVGTAALSFLQISIILLLFRLQHCARQVTSLSAAEDISQIVCKPFVDEFWRFVPDCYFVWWWWTFYRNIGIDACKNVLDSRPDSDRTHLSAAVDAAVNCYFGVCSVNDHVCRACDFSARTISSAEDISCRDWIGIVRSDFSAGDCDCRTSFIFRINDRTLVTVFNHFNDYIAYYTVSASAVDVSKSRPFENWYCHVSLNL